eukprot:1076699-Pleurochrysis_carterae.AAC.1
MPLQLDTMNTTAAWKHGTFACVRIFISFVRTHSARTDMRMYFDCSRALARMFVCLSAHLCSSAQVSPDEPDAPFHAMNCSKGVGIGSSFGSICVSPVGAFSLHDASGRRVLTSLPEQSSRAQLAIATSKSSLLYGRGCSKQDATRLTAPPRLPSVGNSATYAPHYFSTDGYAALGVVG